MPEHEKFELGDLSTRRESIFDIYANKISTVAVGPKTYPCATCKQKTLGGEALTQTGKAIDARLQAIGVDI